MHLQALKGATVCCLCGWYTRLQQLQPNKIIWYNRDFQHSNTFAIGRVVRWLALERVLDSCHLAAKLMLLVASESISKSWVYGHHSSPHFLETSLCFMFLLVLGSFWQRTRASYKLHRLHRYRSWQDLRKWNLQQRPGRLRGAFLAPRLGNFARLVEDACWYSCPDCPTIHNSS